MSVAPVNDEDFRQLLHERQGRIVVDFYADWCGPCHQLAPVIDSLAKTYVGKIVFAKVNVDDEPELASKYGIQSIPAVILFEAGEARARSIGAKPSRTLARDLGLDDLFGGKDSGEPESREKIATHQSWWANRCERGLCTPVAIAVAVALLIADGVRHLL